MSPNALPHETLKQSIANMGTAAAPDRKIDSEELSRDRLRAFARVRLRLKVCHQV
jgi:hypothetical protein